MKCNKILIVCELYFNAFTIARFRNLITNFELEFETPNGRVKQQYSVSCVRRRFKTFCDVSKQSWVEGNGVRLSTNLLVIVELFISQYKVARRYDVNRRRHRQK